MIVFDQEKLSAFFDTVSRGFQTSPLEIVLVMVAVAAFIALLIIVYRLQHRRIRRQQRILADRRYRQILTKHPLTPSEEELVRRMSRHLKQPEKKYLILINQPTFNFCASRLSNQEPASASALTGLRNKLGFRLQGPEQIPSSSTELPEGQGLLIVDSQAPGRRKAQGRVRKQGPRCLTAELVGSNPTFRTGEPVRVYFQNRSGLFSFESRVQSARTAEVELQHGERIERIQRRKYYRRRISQPVVLRSAGTDQQPVHSTFFDLGGNGASLKNPGGRYEPGDVVELTFLAAGEQCTLVAEVLRTSKNGQVLHVRFAPMRETTRDRIIGSLFKGASLRS